MHIYTCIYLCIYKYIYACIYIYTLWTSGSPSVQTCNLGFLFCFQYISHICLWANYKNSVSLNHSHVYVYICVYMCMLYIYIYIYIDVLMYVCFQLMATSVTSVTSGHMGWSKEISGKVFIRKTWFNIYATMYIYIYIYMIIYIYTQYTYPLVMTTIAGKLP